MMSIHSVPSRLKKITVSVFLLGLFPAQASNWGPGSNSFFGAPNLTSGLGLSATTNLENYTAEGSEPGHRVNGSKGAERTAWWRWTAPQNGFVCIHTLLTRDLQVTEPLGASTLAVYTGSSLGSLERIVANEEHWLPRDSFLYMGHSSVAFYAIKGTVYRVAVDGRQTGSVNASSKNMVLLLRQIPHLNLSRRTVWGVGSSPEYRGSLTLQQSGPSAFSAVLIAGRRTFRFRGSYDVEGYFRGSFQLPTPRGALPVPPLSLEIDGVSSARVKLNDSKGTIYGAPFPEVLTFSAANPNPLTGYFTAISTSGNTTATVAASGRVRGTSRIPDGSTITFSAPLAAAPGATQYYLTTHRLLRRGSGYWQLRSVMEDKGVQDDWFSDGVTCRFYRAPNPGATYLPFGIDSAFLLFGGTYQRPASGDRPFGFLNPIGNGKIILSGGDLLSNMTENLIWNSDNRIAVTASSNNTVLRFNARTGMLTGSTRLPAERLRSLRAVIARNNGITYVGGYASGRTSPSSVSITPP